MKKIYLKPEIAFESFSLSTNIAGDCEVKTHIPGNNTCGVDLSGLMVFMEGMNGCSGVAVENVNGDGMYADKICYHVPNGQNVFNS